MEIINRKICTKCGEEKELSYFDKHNNCRFGVNSFCKKCSSEKAKKWRLNNKEHIVKQKRIYNLKRRYGIDVDFYEFLLNKQGNKCAICSNKLWTNDGHRLAVDHCHATGKVRGLLCKVCNNAIGLFRENIEYFKKSIEYLNGEK